VDFVAIQGDGAFGLFWGDSRLARAMCAAITIKTFSYKHLTPRLEKKWPDLPETGLKVGIGNSPLLVKRVGVPQVGPRGESTARRNRCPIWSIGAVLIVSDAFISP
jgi:hypothetical protein